MAGQGRLATPAKGPPDPGSNTLTIMLIWPRILSGEVVPLRPKKHF